MSVEATRDRFVNEMVQRGPGSVGLEMNVAGFADARRRFVLAIQGWEKNLWMRPLLTRLEGYFERTPDNDKTFVVFEKRGLSLPLFVLGWLLPYTVARNIIGEWPPTTYDVIVIGVSILLFFIAIGVLNLVERRVQRLLVKSLQTIYDQAPIDNA
jgi:hypothetical protein